jgi:polyketide synthase Type III
LQRGIFLDDDPGVLISACLFGDGAGAAVLSNRPQPKKRRSVEWKFAASQLVTAERDTLRFSHKNGMLRNILLAASAAGRRQNCR